MAKPPKNNKPTPADLKAFEDAFAEVTAVKTQQAGSSRVEFLDEVSITEMPGYNADTMQVKLVASVSIADRKVRDASGQPMVDSKGVAQTYQVYDFDLLRPATTVEELAELKSGDYSNLHTGYSRNPHQRKGTWELRDCLRASGIPQSKDADGAVECDALEPESLWVVIIQLHQGTDTDPNYRWIQFETLKSL
jgi:hypothetical protein